MKYVNESFVCFDRKHFVKIGFLIFQYLVASEKMSQRKTTFGQPKKYSLFLEINFY